MNKPDALTLVIFGASGDLTRRKLMPALYLLYKAGRLPRRFAVLGMARTSYDDDRFRTSIREGLLSFVRPDEVDEKAIQAFLSCLHYLSADPSEPEAYAELKTRLEEIDRTIDNPHNYLYYLATPPLLYGVIPRHLKAEGLNREGDGFRRIVVEKPFGYDLSSALELNRIYLDADLSYRSFFGERDGTEYTGSPFCQQCLRAFMESKLYRLRRDYGRGEYGNRDAGRFL